MNLKDSTILFRPRWVQFENNQIHFFVDDEAPNWISTDERGGQILNLVDGKRNLGDLIKEYRKEYGLDSAVAWLHVYDFVKAGIRHQMLFLDPVERAPYTGRGDYLKPVKLNEFWIHTNNSCNLTCTHCLVSSHPGGDPGLSTQNLMKVINEAYQLGARRFYFTGGEPFLRKDIFDLIEHITQNKKAELIILTNATLFQDGRLKRLNEVDRDKVFLQVSLDGSTKHFNDPIRGDGTFAKITEGLRLVSDLGFHTSLTAVVTNENFQDISGLPFLAKSLGAQSIHLMWPHRRGRLLECGNGNSIPSNPELLQLVRTVKKNSEEVGIVLDNYESFKMRVNSQPGTKYDLSNACWDSLCLYSNGHLFPSAAFANHPSLDMGDAVAGSIQEFWFNSPVAKAFRAATLMRKAGIKENPFRFMTGGGDEEHTYFLSETRKKNGNILEEDPYDSFYQEMVRDIMLDLSRKKKEALNDRSGYSSPVIFHAMGEGALVCGTTGLELLTENQVHTLHSNCVLSFDVEKPHQIVKKFYGKAAEKPQAELCCPVHYDLEEIQHIPEEVLERFYGCGSPVTLAGLKPGEWMLDLGSGGGIDCFIAAKKVGPEGKVIGVDMTDQMLEVARRNKVSVSQNLGFDVVDFQKGYLEKIPAESQSVDLITSNCVINLSPDKNQVFSEMWRVLKDQGRIVISDIVSDRPTPPHIRINEQLWGECLSGALTEEEFLAGLEKAGFYGLEVLKKDYWKEVEGYHFYSVTVRGFKFEKKGRCEYLGHQAIYRGPFKAVMDEEGHFFQRNDALEVCTDTVEKLLKDPYSHWFTIVEPDRTIVEVNAPVGSCAPKEDEEKCG
jgi:MoaA/NifB/PqqE/SkfB family radical SAM enzyme/SAM-dependent methyltransferase